MSHRPHGNHSSHWLHLVHFLLHTEKGGVLPGIALCVIGSALTPVLIGLPLMALGAYKVYKALT